MTNYLDDEQFSIYRDILKERNDKNISDELINQKIEAEILKKQNALKLAIYDFEKVIKHNILKQEEKRILVEMRIKNIIIHLWCLIERYNSLGKIFKQKC